MEDEDQMEFVVVECIVEWWWWNMLLNLLEVTYCSRYFISEDVGTGGEYSGE
jgi:hypothetical protein